MLPNNKPYVLLVDDIQSNLELLELSLAGLNVNIIKASSGEEALSKIKNYELAIALIDIMMPNMDGYQLVEKIRNDKSREIFPILFITAFHNNPADIFKGYESGAIDFIFKPVDVSILKNKVRLFLEFDRQKRELTKISTYLEKSRHELEVNQNKLEKQNEELRIAKLAAQDAAEKYTELYNFAPSSFFTLSKEGKILELNLAAAKILGCERTFLKNSQFDYFLSADSRTIFYQFLTNIFNNKTHETCELILSINDNLTRIVYLSGKIAENFEYCYVTCVDITDRKQAEEEIKLSHNQLREYASRLQQIREEERTSIAREIHDEFGQVLTAIKMNLSMVAIEARNTGKPIKRSDIIDEINNMNKIIDNTIQNVRAFTNKLRPDVLDYFGLIEALDVHIKDFSKLYKIKYSFIKPEEVIDIDSDKSIAIYRIVQEALTNVARHANASEVKIIIQIKNDILDVLVEDNGVGMSVDKMEYMSKFGIIGMKERAYIFGGSLTINALPEKGTKVKLLMPIINEHD